MRRRRRPGTRPGLDAWSALLIASRARSALMTAALMAAGSALMAAAARARSELERRFAFERSDRELKLDDLPTFNI